MTNAALRHLYANQQGSVVLAADVSGGAARQFKFDEYGTPQAGQGGSLSPSQGARFLYTGQALIPELGMYYYKARMYSWVLGRFMQVDPIGYKDQNKLYAYVGNDPVNRVDPTGLYECSGSTGQCGAVAAAYNRGTEALKSNNLTKAERTMLQGALAALGAPGVKNGVSVSFATSQQIAAKSGDGFAYTEKTKTGISVVLPNTYAQSFNTWGPSNPASPLAGQSGRFSAENARANAFAHEGTHVKQFEHGMTQGQYNRNPTPFEREAYRTGNSVNKASRTLSPFPEP